ncbi:MAG: hypothetical protein ACPG31_02495 [Planctomycetota bacterium]
MTIRQEVEEIWPALEWFQGADLRAQSVQIELASFERSSLDAQDLREISGHLPVEGRKVSFPVPSPLAANFVPKTTLKTGEFMDEDMPVGQDFQTDGDFVTRKSHTFMSHCTDFMSHEPFANGHTS